MRNTFLLAIFFIDGQAGSQMCTEVLESKKNDEDSSWCQIVWAHLSSLKAPKMLWICHVILRFGLVSLFNGISTFAGYLMPKPFS